MKIVAPAGNMDRFYAAIKAGADEIYLGLKGFGARRSAENFSIEQIKEAIDFAHLRGSKIFLTLNTIMTNSEIEILYDILKELYEYGLDAIIVQDIGYAKYLKENFPNIEIHGSTQLTVANHYEINYLKKLGFSRVVLPRELTFEEIKKIRENTDMELEVFVSGALCICFSGNCYMSSFIGGRSGNRGMCAQPCRKEYTTNNEKKSYFLSPKDQLLGNDEIKKLKDLGIESIKIEGRMKEVNYVFQTVDYYKKLIDEVEVEEKTSKLFNRGYSKGYFYGENIDIMNRDFSYNMGEKIGVATGKIVKLSSDLICGDGVTFLSKNYENLGGNYISKIDLRGKREDRKIAYAGEEIILECPKGTKYIYKNYNKKLNDELSRRVKTEDKKLEIYGEFIGKIGENAKYKVSYMTSNNILIECEYTSDFIVDKAQKKAVDTEQIIEKFSETGDSEFTFKKIIVDIDENIFVPMSEIKNMKREALNIFKEKLLLSFQRNLDEDLKDKGFIYYKLNIEKDIPKEPKIFAIVSNQKQYNYLKEKMNEENLSNIYYRSYDVAKESELEKHNLDKPLAANLFQMLENKTNEVILNWNLNIVNSYTIKVLEDVNKLKGFIVSPEINFAKIRTLGKTRLEKYLLVYSKLKGMTIDINFGENKTITNKEGDNFKVIRNEFGTEIFLEKPLNIINDLDELKNLCVDAFVLEFTTETLDEIDKVLKQIRTKKGEYREYNYRRGVY